MIAPEVRSRLVGDLLLASEPFRDFLLDPNVVEIMANPDGRLWIDRLGSGMSMAGEIAPGQVDRIIKTAAALSETVVTRHSPIIETELPADPPFSGSRFEGLFPPVVANPAFSLRKRASLVWSLEDYEKKGSFDAGERTSGRIPSWKEGVTGGADLLRRAVSVRKNIVVVGSTGSGKTTLANALLLEVAREGNRVVTIEDTLELQCPADNLVSLRTSETVDMARLLRATLRLRPDRIVVGEVRGPEGYVLLKAWNTGHPGGIATVHADSARGGLVRLEQLAQEAGIPAEAVRPVIAESVHLVVFIERTPSGRRISEILEVDGLSSSGYRTTNLVGGVS